MWLPIYPAPPVTRTVMLGPRSCLRFWRRLAIAIRRTIIDLSVQAVVTPSSRYCPLPAVPAPARLTHRLADLDPATRQVPATHVAMIDQKDAPLLVDHQPPHPSR